MITALTENERRIFLIYGGSNSPTLASKSWYNVGAYISHPKSVMLCHLVFPAKYRRNVFTEDAGEMLKENC